jgi:hypothetical protein
VLAKPSSRTAWLSFTIWASPASATSAVALAAVALAAVALAAVALAGSAGGWGVLVCAEAEPDSAVSGEKLVIRNNDRIISPEVALICTLI